MLTAMECYDVRFRRLSLGDLVDYDGMVGVVIGFCDDMDGDCDQDGPFMTQWPGVHVRYADGGVVAEERVELSMACRWMYDDRLVASEVEIVGRL